MSLVLKTPTNPGEAQWTEVVELEEVSACMTEVLRLGANPTSGDTVTFGADTYEFVTSGGSVSADTNIAVTLGGSAEASGNALRDAINGTAANPNPNVTLTDGVTPAVGVGTEALKAADFDPFAGGLRFGPATEQGGDTPTFGPVNLVLSETFANAANAFTSLPAGGNLDEIGPRAEGPKRVARVVFTATTQLINYGEITVQLPFEPTWAQLVVSGISGFSTVFRYNENFFPGDNTGFSSVYGPATIEYTAVFGGGASPNIQNGDLVVLSFFE